MAKKKAVTDRKAPEPREPRASLASSLRRYRKRAKEEGDDAVAEVCRVALAAMLRLRADAARDAILAEAAALESEDASEPRASLASSLRRYRKRAKEEGDDAVAEVCRVALAAMLRLRADAARDAILAEAAALESEDASEPRASLASSLRRYRKRAKEEGDDAVAEVCRVALAAMLRLRADAARDAILAEAAALESEDDADLVAEDNAAG